MTHQAKQMKAIGNMEYSLSTEVLKLFDVPIPQVLPRDLLVKNRSAATNPVDGKKRKNEGGKMEEKRESPLICGWDAAGVVVQVGNAVSMFKVGDEVMYAGLITRTGSFAEYTAVDERIVGRKPKSINWNQAATVPLTALTAWEGLTEQMGIPIPMKDDTKLNAAKSILVISGAGGVGSMAIQIARRVLNMGTVIATASRKETIEWCKKKGATLVIGHQNMLDQLTKNGLKGVDYILNCAETDTNFDQLPPIVNPLGKICCITFPSQSLNVNPLFFKRATLVFELMFTRPLFDWEQEKQGAILNRVAEIIDSGVMEHNMTNTFNFTESDLRKAEDLQDSGKAMGKSAIEISKD